MKPNNLADVTLYLHRKQIFGCKESILELDAVQVWGTAGCILHLVFRDKVPIFTSLCGI